MPTLQGRVHLERNGWLASVEVQVVMTDEQLDQLMAMDSPPQLRIVVDSMEESG